jgi:hypothetical protein
MCFGPCSTAYALAGSESYWVPIRSKPLQHEDYVGLPSQCVRWAGMSYTDRSPDRFAHNCISAFQQRMHQPRMRITYTVPAVIHNERHI